MKTYIDYGEAIYYLDTYIFKSLGNPSYRLFLNELENGEAELIPYVLTESFTPWANIIRKREQLLRDSDYRVLPDANPETKDLWLAYREILRNITETFSTPESVIWPIPPEL